MPDTRQSAVFSIGGYEVSATFANNNNKAAISQAKQILLSSFANMTKARVPDILVIAAEQRDNNSGSDPHAP